MLSFVSSWEIDNKKYYDETTKTITIKNSFLGIPLDKVAEIELKTPLNFKVPRGYQKVAEFEIRNFEDYTNALKQLKFYNLRDGSNEILRNFDYKYKTYVNVSVNDYENVIIGISKNGTNIYERQLVGSHLEVREKWTNLSSTNFNKDDILTIGIFTDVKKGDIIEWIPTFYGKEIFEWAVWSENLNVGLITYLKLDETSGTTAIDSLNLNNFTNVGATVNVTGKIKTAYQFSTDYLSNSSFSGLPTSASDRTICSWIYPTSSASSTYMWSYGVASVLEGFGLIYLSSTKFSTWINGGDLTGTNNHAINNWHYVCITYDGTTRLYVDGVNEGNLSQTLNTASSTVRIGSYITGGIGLVGTEDEWSIWNRTLSVSEIQQLYNNGIGITYTKFLITLNSPVNAFETANRIINFNGSVTSIDEIINVSLILDGVFNEINSSGVNNIDYLFTKTISDGSHNWTYEACNVDGCSTATVRTFMIDTNPPQINISSPTSILGFNTFGQNETLNITFTDTNLNTCWFDYNGTNITINGCLSGVLNSTQFILEEGNLNLTAYTNDTVGNLASQFISWDYIIFQTGISFNSPVVELSTQEFIINVTSLAGTSIQSADLIYNGTKFSTADKTPLAGNSFTLSKIISIPPGTTGFVNENRTFFWNLTSVNETSGLILNFNSTESTQLVNELEFGLCNGSFDVPILNFTMLNEVDGLEINAIENATTFQATFIVGASSDNLIKNISINQINVNNSRFNFCTTDNTTTIFADMELFYTAVGFSDKNYFLNNATLTNNTNLINLFLLPESLSVQFFITVERDLFPLENAVVNVDKFFVGEGFFQTVEIDTTDSSGEFTSFLDLDKDYRFSIVLDEELLSIINKTAICQAAPCTFTLSITEDSINLLSGLSEAFASNVLYNLSYNGATKIITFQFIDTTGLATSFRMVITKTVSNQTEEIISDQRIFTSSGSMTFNMSGQQGDFRVDTFIARSPDQFIDFITLIINNLPGVTGILGLLFALLLIITIIFGVALKPQLLIMAIPLALYITKLMGIISLSNGAIISIAVLAAIAVAFTSK